MNRPFLALYKDFFYNDLKLIDKVILSQAEEFQRNNCDFCMTNEQLSKMLGETIYAVKASLDRLEEKKYITRENSFINNNGRANKQRIIKLNAEKSINSN